MKGTLSRFGLGYRYAPEGVPIILGFSRIGDRGTEFPAELAVYNAGARDATITRQVNLKASLTQGALAGVLKELQELSNGSAVDWKAVLREASESVIASHRAGHPVRVIQGEVKRPPPPSWLAQGLLLKNKPNCWLGAASTGKSTLAKAVCAYYASGYRFCDREMERGVPFYLDWEDDEDSFTRVVIDICSSLGVRPVPLMLWRDMHGYRLRDQIETIGEYIDRYNVGLLVLDAVAAAGGGGGEHVSWEDIALEMERCLGSLPLVTVLALDHVTGEELKLGSKAPVPIKARGAARKYEYLRNQWSLVTDQTAALDGRHVVNWHHTKNNVGRKETQGFATEIEHREDEISIVVRPIEMPEAAEVQSVEASTADLILAKLAEATDQTIGELAWRLDGKPGRERLVRTTLDRAVRMGRAIRTAQNPSRYTLVGGPQGVLVPFPGA